MGDVLFKLVLLQITFGEELAVGQVLPVFHTVICIPLVAGVAEAVTHGKLPVEVGPQKLTKVGVFGG